MRIRDAAALIRKRVEMEQIAEMYLTGEEVRRGFVRCPFHGEKTGSLKLYEDSYYCFGCHAHGDAVDFVGRLLHLPPTEAAKRINRDFSLGLPLDDGEQMPMRERLELMRRSEAAARARAAEREECRARERAYSDAADECARLEVLMRDHEPVDRDAPFPAEWVEAARRVDQARYVLEEMTLMGK